MAIIGITKSYFMHKKLKYDYFYIKMKIRVGGGALGQEGGALGQQGAPPCYSSLWGNTNTYNGKNVVSTLVLSFWMDLHHSCRYQGHPLKL